MFCQILKWEEASKPSLKFKSMELLGHPMNLSTLFCWQTMAEADPKCFIWGVEGTWRVQSASHRIFSAMPTGAISIQQIQEFFFDVLNSTHWHRSHGWTWLRVNMDVAAWWHDGWHGVFPDAGVASWRVLSSILPCRFTCQSRCELPGLVTKQT